MIVNVILILIILKLSRGSMVIDSLSQNTIYVSNYCPAMKYCKEGSHVMCKYYDHGRIIGPQCKNYVRVTVTPQMVQQILQQVNDIRKKVATGKETGKDGHLLPRGYGMMKMHWDSELATLAQVLADQCLGLREDECRATEKFPNPSQIITLVNFKVPHWEYLTRNTTDRGLNKGKVSFAIDKALKSLHAVKRLVTTNTIVECPAMENLPDMGSRSYLKLIRGKATHIGCGISGYTRYNMLNSGAQNIYNSVQIVCNISDGPQQSQPLYMTDPPILGTGFTENCGCPQGYRESNGCLCEAIVHHNIATTIRPYQWMERIQTDTNQFDKDKFAINQRGNDSPSPYKQAQTPPCIESNGNCEGEPRTVLLPIFEIQNAPNTNSYEPNNEVEMLYHRRFGNSSFIPDLPSVEENEISSENFLETLNGFRKFRKNKNRNIIQTHKTIPSKPRKNKFKSHGNRGSSDEVKSDKDTVYSSVEDNVVENHQYSRPSNDYDDKINFNDMYKDSDNSFMYLLDHLERAVKNIELEGDDRELFDIKMRKIYESALKTKTQNMKMFKSTSSPITTTFKPEEIESDIQEITDYFREKDDQSYGDDRVPYELRSWSKDTKKLNKHTPVDKDTNDYYSDRKENESEEFNKGIDDKLIHILNRKNTNGDLDRKYDYFINNNINKDLDTEHYNVDRLYDEADEYANLPASRNQEKINKYNKNLKETNVEKSIEKHNHNFRTHHGHPYKFGKKKSNEGHKKKHAFDLDQAVKRFGRKKVSYHEDDSMRTQDNPGYRRVYETDDERPTLPMRQKNSTTKTGSHKERYHLSNRAVL